MHKLKQILVNYFDQVEIYYSNNNDSSIFIKNGRVEDLYSGIDSGYAIRVIKNNKVGYAVCNNLNNHEQIIDNLNFSLQTNISADVSFPIPNELQKIN